MIESCFVVALLSLALFGVMEVSRLFTAREVNDYAATAGARARAVGFNDFMVYKVVHVAAIPNAGPIRTPSYQSVSGLLDPINRWGAGAVWSYALRSTPASGQYQVEQSRIPLYLGAVSFAQLSPILNYERWDDLRHYQNDPAAGLTRVEVRQDIPLRFPFHRAFYDSDEVREESEQVIDNHYPLYLQ